MESNPRRLLTSSDQTGSQVASDGGLAVWPSGKALGWFAEGPRFESASALFSSDVVACGQALSCDSVPHN